MDAETKAKWIAALRSGKFVQGFSELKSPNDQYCCLGVLAEVKGCAWYGGEPIHDGTRVALPDEYYLLPEFAELTHDTQEKLAAMNDSDKSFSEIADYIEQNVVVTCRQREGTP